MGFMNFRYLFSRNVFVFLICLFSGSFLVGSDVLVVGFNDSKVEAVRGQLHGYEHCAYQHLMSVPTQELMSMTDAFKALHSKVSNCDLLYFVLDASFLHLTQSFSFAKQTMKKTVVLHLSEGLSHVAISKARDVLQYVDILVVDLEILGSADLSLDLVAHNVLIVDNKPGSTTKYMGKKKYETTWFEVNNFVAFVMTSIQ